MASSVHLRGADLRRRTEALALSILQIVRQIRNDPEGRVLAGQLLRAGTSVGANYRAACRARSRREFVAKLGIALEEADEVVYWTHLFERSGTGPNAVLQATRMEAGELVRILAASIVTAKRRAGKPR
jgi:four helix bundle protein